jgi:hypothetical protein
MTCRRSPGSGSDIVFSCEDTTSIAFAGMISPDC